MQPISISSPQTLRERSILYTRRIACFSFGGSAACMVPTLLTASLSLQAASALFRVTNNAPDENVILPLNPSSCGLISALRSLATMFTPASFGRISAVFLFAAGAHVGFLRAVDLDLDIPLLVLQLACFACWQCLPRCTVYSGRRSTPAGLVAASALTGVSTEDVGCVDDLTFFFGACTL